MEIKKIQIKEVWEGFLSGCKEKTFLQSWNWGEFQKMMGNKIWRFGIFENDNLISTAFFYKIQAKRGTFLFLPHSLVFKQQATSNKQQVLKILLEKLKKIAKEENASFIRVGPILEGTKENIEIFKNLGFRNAPIHIHPELTWELDISPLKEELLKNMRKTTRYLIRKSPKEGVEIFSSQNPKDLEIFYKLYRDVVSRQKFIPFSLKYLKNEFSSFSPDNQILIFFGKYKNEIISSGIFIFWQNLAFYHHGASLLRYSKIPASYSLLWEAILKAKKRGCQKFNFWGIASKENPKHPWAGLTLFKKGFGGYKKEYVKTQDFPISQKYWLTFIFEKIRKTKRGF
ncbi:peptidoglycan bridge formation glycyltransferase FemA/FemB family protein [Patescibacteria group bacterium]|nr:peptidoglycan bridge formation glycyltransferase FemA/FemB family protein [Patescibacteria group bacterium]